MKITALVKGTLISALLSLPLGAQAYASNMTTLGITSQPVGHYDFCRANPGECKQRSGRSKPMKLTKSAWNKILKINYNVNRAIRPKTDMEMFGVEEVWSFPKTVGDCEDYVLLKRHMLMNAGLKASDLLITVVRQPDGSGHAVLTVRTDLGDFILDNMRNKVLLWSDTEYTFLKRQSSHHSGKWTRLKQSRSTTAVGSIQGK
ncbi:MAG: transglutaminase-like cysteine peptidase [Hyphomicrobiales bacterium]|nr:transglutaminase-like cysteine peptidase [Hyphomicrobiales bacterium]MCP5000321.1 transglutaminase-like cysteine peptidase [Hyphomicrobiales bacterium]